MADFGKRSSVDEKTMVKSGLSVAAGAGSTSFAAAGTWRAGESVVVRAPGDPLVATLSCFYRDSFFMYASPSRSSNLWGVTSLPPCACSLHPEVTRIESVLRRCLREDTCCGGRCAPSAADGAAGASSSDLRAAATALDLHDAGSAVAQSVRDRVVRERETREALARKRPKDEGPIDLCTSDEDD